MELSARSPIQIDMQIEMPQNKYTFYCLKSFNPSYITILF